MNVPLPPESDPVALINALLDIISNEPGAIIYRGPETWEALMPDAPPGSVVTMGSNGLPFWGDL